MDRQTGAKRVQASGVLKPIGLAFEPTTQRLWAIANERDEIGPDLVPDYLTAVQENGFYGWPYSYWGQHVDERVQPQRTDIVAKSIRPNYGLGSHVAPLGLAFTRRNSLPPQHQNGAFAGEHGSWDRDPSVGYKVVFVPFQNGEPSGPPQDVLTGFISDGKTRGRPVGVALEKTGRAASAGRRRKYRLAPHGNLDARRGSHAGPANPSRAFNADAPARSSRRGPLLRGSLRGACGFLSPRPLL